MNGQVNIFIIFWILFGLKFNWWIDTAFFIVIPFIYFFEGSAVTRRIILITLIYSMLTVLVLLYSGIFDAWHLGQPIKSILSLLGIFGFLAFAFGHSLKRLKQSIVCAVLIHSTLIIICYFFRDFQEVLNSFTGFQSKSEFRVNGFTHSYGTTSLIHVAVIPLVSELYHGKKKVIALFLIMMSAMFMARVGLYLGIIFLVIINYKAIGFRKLLIGGCSCYGGYHLIVFLANTDPKNFTGSAQLYFLSVRWALETFVSFIDSGVVTNKSIETMNIAISNETVIEHFFGTGDFGRNDVHLETDISYLLYYSYCGLIGIVLLIFVHSRLRLDSVRNIGFLVILLVTALKEPTFYTRGLWALYVLFLYLDYVAIKRRSVTGPSTKTKTS